MQPRDNLSEPLSTPYERPIIISQPRAVPAVKRTIAVLASWLVPGAGHLVLGQFGRALLFFLTITGSFCLGLALDAKLFWPSADPTSAIHYDLISCLWFFSQIGSGLCYIGSYVLGFGLTPRPEAATFEYGNGFTFLAGLLNYLVILDAFDIAAGRKR